MASLIVSYTDHRHDAAIMDHIIRIVDSCGKNEYDGPAYGPRDRVEMYFYGPESTVKKAVAEFKKVKAVKVKATYPSR